MQSEILVQDGEESVRAAPTPDVMASSPDMAIQRILLYRSLCWAMSSFVGFPTDGISSDF